MSNPSTAQRLEAAEASLVEMTAQIATANATATASNATIAQLTADLTTAQASIKSLDTELASTKAALETANASNLAALADSSRIAAENVTLRAKEQDVEKRASARLATMQAGLGISPPLATGAPASGGGKQELKLFGLERAIAAHKSSAKN